MNTLYDSDSFVVMHIQADLAWMADASEPASGAAAVRLDASGVGLLNGEQPRLARHGFEIVDKRSGKEIYLDGSWAEMFQQQIIAWQQDTPTQEEVEDTLEGYTALAHTPVVMH